MRARLIASGAAAAFALLLGWVLSGRRESVQPVERAEAAGAPGLVVQLGHGQSVNDVAWSADGRLLLSASSDKTLRLWDVASGRELGAFTGAAGAVNAAAFLPDGRRALSGSADGTLKLWEVATRRELRSLSAHEKGVNAIAVAPDGRFAVSGGGDGLVKQWDVTTGRLIRSFAGHSDAVRSVALSAEGARVLSGGLDGTLRLWDVATGRLLRRFDADPEGVNVVALSPDGRRGLSGGVRGGLRSWDLDTGASRALAGDGVVSGVAFSADGRQAASGDLGSTPAIWDLEAQRARPMSADAGHNRGVFCVAFSPDGRLLASGGGAGLEDDHLIVWDVASGRALPAFGRAVHAVFSVAVSPDGRYLASGSDGIRLWDLQTGRVDRRLANEGDDAFPGTDPPHRIRFSPEGRRIAATRGAGIEIWDLGTETSRELDDLSKSKDAVFSPDGRHVLGLGWGITTTLWDASDGRPVRRFAHGTANLDAAAFSPDGRRVSLAGSRPQGGSADWGPYLGIWDVASGKELKQLRGHTEQVTTVAWSSDGKTILSGSTDRTARLWDAETGRPLLTLSGHGREVWSVALSPDGRQALTGSWDGTARLWDVGNGRELRRLQHVAQVASVTFSPDGGLAFTGSWDGTLRVWNLAGSETEARELCRLVSFADGSWVVVEPGGRFDASRLEELRGVHWVMPDDPLRPLPVEIFMREYYEPRLLPRLIAGERLRPVRALSALDRAQPRVQIAGIEPGGAPDEVTVTVDVGEGAHDLRLFRDGQLVGHAPVAGGRLDAGPVRFPARRLPRDGRTQSVEFSAYAFNADRVKSATDRKAYALPKRLAPLRGRAYVLSVGVNEHENPRWNLRFAANDARALSQALAGALSRRGDYAEVVSVSLLAENEAAGAAVRTATKANVKAALELLAGRDADPALLRALPAAAALRPARPEDVVVISYAGHGYADGDGVFYLVPHDTGPASRKGISRELLARCISSDELSLWLRDVDAGELVLIVDACFSAAAVEGKEFKPGPMGSRGLGQLSYDKGMRILTATQANNVALEDRRIGHGLLTYALAHDGLASGLADFRPKDGSVLMSEWLRYGVERVPQLYEEVRRGKRRLLVFDAESGAPGAQGAVLQRPSLFDFAARRPEIQLEVTR